MKNSKKMTEEEWQNLYENFETTWLLDSVKHIDKARGYLGDGENWEPPEIRTDLLKLHQLAMDVVNNGWTDKAQEFFDMAFDLETQVEDIIESLEFVQSALNKLTELYPESLIEYLNFYNIISAKLFQVMEPTKRCVSKLYNASVVSWVQLTTSNTKKQIFPYNLSI